MEVGLTTGTPWKQFLRFTAPIAAGRLLSSCYTIADTKIIGILSGKTDLAAVGSISAFYHLLNGFLDGIALGCCVLLAMDAGKQDRIGQRKSYVQMAGIMFILTGTLTAVLMGGSNWILAFLRVPPEEIGPAGDYLRILLTGLAVTGFNFLYINLIRSLYDTMAPLCFLGISVAFNIGMDFVFVGRLHTGAAGAALATVLAQSLSLVLCVIHVRRKFRWLRLSVAGFGDKRHFHLLLRSGLAMGFQSCLVNIGTIVLQIAINGMGSEIIIAHAAARRVFELMYIPYVSLGSAVVTYTASNQGAGQFGRLKQGYRDALRIVLVCSVFACIAGELLPEVLIAYMASSKDPEIILWGARYLRVELPALVLCGVVVISRSYLQGRGRRVIPVLSSVLELSIKVICALLSITSIYYWGIIFSEPVSWLGMSIMLAAAIRIPGRHRQLERDENCAALK